MIEKLRWPTAAEIISKAGSIVTIPILTRLLVPAEYGIYRSIFLIVAILSVHGYLNVNSILRKQLPQLSADSDRSVLVSTIISVTATLLLISFLFLVALVSTGNLTLLSVEVQEFVGNHLGLIFVLLLFHPLYTVCLGILTGLRNFRKYAYVKAAAELSILAGIGGLGLAGALSIVTALWVVALVRVAASVTVLFWIRNLVFSSPDLSELLSQIRAISIPLLPRYLIKQGESIVPSAVVLMVFGPTVFAAWNVVFAFDQMFLLFSRPLSSVFLPELSSRITDDDPISPILENFYLFMSVLVTPIALGGWVVGSQIVSLVFGSDYVVKSLLAPLMITAFGCKVLTTIDSHYYIARGRSGFESIAGLAGGFVFGICLALSVFVFDSVLVVAFGLVGSWAIRLVIGYLYQRRTADLGVPSPGRVAKFIIALALMVAVVSTLEPHISGIVTLLAVVGAGAVIYFSLLFLLQFFDSGEYNIVRRFISI